MVASLKLKGIDGKAHKEWNLRLNLTQHGTTHRVQIRYMKDKRKDFSQLRKWWCMAVLSSWIDLSGLFR